MSEENVLTDFEKEEKIERPIQWSSIIISVFLCGVCLWSSYQYYEMYFINQNKDRLFTALLYAFVAGCQLAFAVTHTIIRYKFIRKSDLNRYAQRTKSSSE